MFTKSSLFLIFIIVPIALSNTEIYNKLENSEEGKSILNTILIQTKLNGNNADSIRNVLNASQQRNSNGFEKFQVTAKKIKAACKTDVASLRETLNENISKKYSIEKSKESTSLLKQRKVSFSADLTNEISGFAAQTLEVEKTKASWKKFYDSMNGSINAAFVALRKITELVASSNPQLTASFVQTQNKESLINEIRSELEYRFYDVIGMKPILSNLLEVVAKGISGAQYHQIMKTVDLINNFLVNRQNNLIEDNEYETQYNENLVNSLVDSKNSSVTEKGIIDGVVSSLDNRIALLNVAYNNSGSLVNSSRLVLAARSKICEHFQGTYFTHIRRYHNVKLAIAELSNALGDEYKEFQSFIQKKLDNKFE